MSVSSRPLEVDRETLISRAGSDVVRVFTTVTDRDGRLVPNLTRDAFEVRDEGQPQSGERQQSEWLTKSGDLGRLASLCAKRKRQLG